MVKTRYLHAFRIALVGLFLSVGLVMASPAIADVNRATGVIIGGPFTLTDHTGKKVTEADFRGKYLLVFFGFTYCPDVCPTALGEISSVIDALDVDADKVAPLFITIDPERDSPEAMADLLGHFNPAIVGLTGSPSEIDKAASAYHVYRKKNGEGEDYLMDHSAVTYLMGPDGKYILHFSANTNPFDMTQAILDEMK